ncbi:hypothetical protein Tco_0480880 [Tanacetum coccineum]
MCRSFMCSSQDSSRLDVAVKFIFQSSRYVVPTGRVVVPTGRYIVPAGKVIIIVSTGRLSLVPTSRVLSPVKKCKKWYWKDLELETDWYRSHMREMYYILNQIESEELETEMRSRDALGTMEVEYANYKIEMEVKMEEFKTELMKKEKKDFFL